MLEDGLLDRFGIQELYGMHTWPGTALGTFGIRPGPLLAAADRFTIEIAGKGAHAMAPHTSVDPVLVAAHTITALQSIASRNINPLEAVVVSTCMVHAGDAFNIIPEHATLTGTVRTLSESVRDTVQVRLTGVAQGTAAAFGATATVELRARRAGDHERSRQDQARGAGRARGGGDSQRARRRAARDGGGGLRPHAQGAARAPIS